MRRQVKRHESTLGKEIVCFAWFKVGCGKLLWLKATTQALFYCIREKISELVIVYIILLFDLFVQNFPLVGRNPWLFFRDAWQASFSSVSTFKGGFTHS